MKSQQIFVSSRNRDYGTPQDLYITFPNGLIKESSSFPSTTSIELSEFSVTRLWYDVQAGVNDSFNVYRSSDMQTFTITLPAGWYSINQDYPGSGTTLENQLASLLTSVVTGVWTVAVSNLTGALTITTPSTGPGSSYKFDFSSPSNRCSDLLGFNKVVLNSVKPSGSPNEVIYAPKPLNLSRTSQLVGHTNLQPATPQGAIDNYGLSYTAFDSSDILAVIPVNLPPRSLILYQASEKINRISIKPSEVRNVRIFITDDSDLPLDLRSEWTAVFRVVYGDNLST